MPDPKDESKILKCPLCRKPKIVCKCKRGGGGDEEKQDENKQELEIENPIAGIEISYDNKLAMLWLDKQKIRGLDDDIIIAQDMTPDLPTLEKLPADEMTNEMLEKLGLAFIDENGEPLSLDKISELLASPELTWLVQRFQESLKQLPELKEGIRLHFSPDTLDKDFRPEFMDLNTYKTFQKKTGLTLTKHDGSSLDDKQTESLMKNDAFKDLASAISQNHQMKLGLDSPQQARELPRSFSTSPPKPTPKGG